MVLEFFNSACLPLLSNHPHICLIPKTKTPQALADFRPISLLNTTYKIIAKILANRLKDLLPDLISPFQAAYVPGRQITDNILISQEIVHSFKKKTRRSKA